MTPRLGVAALSALVFVVAAGPAQAAPDVFAHRGGAYVRGKPQFPENTLPAFGVAALHPPRRPPQMAGCRHTRRLPARLRLLPSSSSAPPFLATTPPQTENYYH